MPKGNRSGSPPATADHTRPYLQQPLHHRWSQALPCAQLVTFIPEGNRSGSPRRRPSAGRGLSDQQSSRTKYSHLKALSVRRASGQIEAALKRQRIAVWRAGGLCCRRRCRCQAAHPASRRPSDTIRSACCLTRSSWMSR